MKCACKNCQWEGSHDLGGGIFLCSKHLDGWRAAKDTEKPFEWLMVLISRGDEKLELDAAEAAL